MYNGSLVLTLAIDLFDFNGASVDEESEGAVQQLSHPLLATPIVVALLYPYLLDIV